MKALITQKIKKNVRFDRNELAGSFGDIGTDLPLIIGMIGVSGIDSASTFIVYGFLQVLSGLYYGVPMAVQPLKAVATIVIAQHLTGDVIYGGGLAIGLIMLFMTITGLVRKLSKIVAKPIVRGVQFGLGLTLANVALKDYVMSNSGFLEWLLVIIAFLIVLFLLGNRKYPAALVVIVLGGVYAVFFQITDLRCFIPSFQFSFPKLNLPDWQNVLDGFLLLALPQIPLSIGNSILASEQLVKDYYPEKKISASKIGFTYSLMNIVSPFLSGIPVCHGSGGMAGHYAFGARTGGSVVIYGMFYLVLGVFFSQSFEEIIKIFPIQILGVILFFEAITLVLLMKDLKSVKSEIYIAIIVGLIAFGIPYGFLIGLVIGVLLYKYKSKFSFLN
jgi:MFS superfamily sulfate permease-like transporter